MDINEPRNPDNQHEAVVRALVTMNSGKYVPRSAATSGGAQGRIYTSAEQELRAQVERQQRIIDELTRTLTQLSRNMFGTVDSGDVYMHVAGASLNGQVAVLEKANAEAYRAALELIEKYGGSK